MKTLTNLLLILSLPFLIGCSVNSTIGNAKKKKEIKNIVKETRKETEESLSEIKQIEEEIKSKASDNSNSVANDFLPELISIKDTLSKLKIELEETEDLPISNYVETKIKLTGISNRINTNVQKVSQINKAIAGIKNNTLKSDVSFPTGNAVLTPSGQAILNSFIKDEILRAISVIEGDTLFKGQKVKVRINVSGYADMQGHGSLEKRQAMNLQLSAERAIAVKKFIEKELNLLKKKHGLIIDIDSKGLGEELPAGITDTEKIDNPERRVCLISSYVIPVLK